MSIEIVSAITDDGLVGWDQFKQLIVKHPDGVLVRVSFVHDVRGRHCSICGRGWELTGPSWANQYYWQDFSELVHQSCWDRFCGLNERGDVFDALLTARIFSFQLTSVPNGYLGVHAGALRPWYSAKLLGTPYTFVIGFRKNVWSVTITSEDGQFADEQTQQMVDNWSIETRARVTHRFEPMQWMFHSWGLAELHDNLREVEKILCLSVRKGT